MYHLPLSLQSVLRRLRWRLTLGLFFDIWPAWAIASLLAAGLVALVCRLFVPAASFLLPWFWLAPLAAAVPALTLCLFRTYRAEQVVALADWLAGGQGVLLALMETGDTRWTDSPFVERAARLALPRPRLRQRLMPLVPAVAFLAVAFWLPQRTPPPDTGMLADDIAADLSSTLIEVKEQGLVTPEEEQRFEEEIERIRRGADERVDSSSWEAADALRERLASDLAAKQDALKWAEESLQRFGAALEGAGPGDPKSALQAAELTKALEKLARSGLLAGAPPHLQQMLKGGSLPADPKALAELVASLAEYLEGTGEGFGELAGLGKGFGRFNPEEFPIGADGADGDGEPGRGGITRGRADAPLTWGEETLPIDRFKAQALPPGAPRSPDDWAPLVELPGAPQEAPVASVPSAARQYGASAGQTAWRRTLAPRHQRAIKKYFGK